MSNKLKYAPTPPPEPEIIITPESGPKKRGRKRTKKQYFTPDTDLAIKEYLASSNQDERDTIFARRIHYPFYKLAENLIHTFKFYYTEVDEKGWFESDDQIGFFFKEVKKIQEALNEFTLK